MDIEAIYKKYYHDIFLYIRRLSGDEDIAEEITQETFVRSMKQIGQVDGNVKSWLMTIARNTYYRYCRRKRIYSEEEQPDLEDPTPQPLERIIKQEETKSILETIEQLPGIYQDVFRARVYQESSFEEIGSIFEKSAGWARVTYFRARQLIREKMEKEERTGDRH